MNHAELERAIRDRGVKKCFIADRIGTPRSAFYLKLNGEREFTQTEIMRLKEVLNLSDKEFMGIFFDPRVEKLSTKEVAR